MLSRIHNPLSPPWIVFSTVHSVTEGFYVRRGGSKEVIRPNLSRNYE